MQSLLDFVRTNAPWLGAGFLLTFASSFGQTFFIAVFAGEIRAAYGLSHGDWGAIYSIATMSSAAVMIFAGGVTDRFRVRWIGVAILCGLAIACVAMSVSGAVWALIGTVFLLRLMGQGMMGHAAMVAMARWFVATRGRAVSLAGLGVSLGEALLPLTFVALLGVFDWRTLWVVAGCALLALAPLLWSLLRHERTPQSFAAEDNSAGMDGRNWTRGEMLRHWLFWAMLPAILGPAAWNTSFFFHQVHIAEVKEWGHPALVALFPLYTFMSIGFMLASGWAVDRFGAGRLAGVYLLPAAAGYAVVALAGGVPAGALGLVLIGATVGVHQTMSAAFWAEFYGTRHLGRIRAATAAAMVLGTALGPAITGALIDLGISFPRQGLGIAAYFVLSSVLAGIGAARAGRRVARTPGQVAG